MTYIKPEVSVLSAVAAIESVQLKLHHNVADALGPDFEKATSPT
jgi:hypothetical protein